MPWWHPLSDDHHGFFALKLTMSMPIRQSPIYIFELSTKLIARDIPDCRRKVYEAIYRRCICKTII